jgi:ABC-type tungstate transport system permease subunit
MRARGGVLTAVHRELKQRKIAEHSDSFQHLILEISTPTSLPDLDLLTRLRRQPKNFSSTTVALQAIDRGSGEEISMKTLTNHVRIR